MTPIAGPDDPCPCGSGKPSGRCCGATPPESGLPAGDVWEAAVIPTDDPAGRPGAVLVVSESQIVALAVLKAPATEPVAVAES